MGSVVRGNVRGDCLSINTTNIVEILFLSLLYVFCLNIGVFFDNSTGASSFWPAGGVILWATYRYSWKMAVFFVALDVFFGPINEITFFNVMMLTPNAIASIVVAKYYKKYEKSYLTSTDNVHNMFMFLVLLCPLYGVLSATIASVVTYLNPTATIPSLAFFAHWSFANHVAALVLCPFFNNWTYKGEAVKKYLLDVLIAIVAILAVFFIYRYFIEHRRFAPQYILVDFPRFKFVYPLMVVFAITKKYRFMKLSGVCAYLASVLEPLVHYTKMELLDNSVLVVNQLNIVLMFSTLYLLSSFVKELSISQKTLLEYAQNLEGLVNSQIKTIESAFLSSPLPMAICSLSNLRVLRVNSKCESFLVIKKENLVGRSLADLFVDKDEFSEVLKKLENKEEFSSVVIKAKRDGGKVFSCEISCSFNHSSEETYALIALSDVSDIKKANQELEKQIHEDALTGVLNRRGFFKSAEDIINKKSNATVMMLDIDKFKNVNDTFGHDVGDKVICLLAETCSKLIKLDRDIIGRLGGEEFAIILYEKTGTDGYKKAEEIRKAVSKETYEVNGEKHSFTVSIGVTTINNGVPDIDVALKRADEALYEAKTAGRNRVKIFHKDSFFARLIKEGN